MELALPSSALVHVSCHNKWILAFIHVIILIIVRKSLKCPQCDKEYEHRQSLDRHIKMKHSVMDVEVATSKGRILCKETGCNFGARYLINLRNHLTEVHSYEFDIFNKNFSSLQGIIIIIMLLLKMRAQYPILMHL